MVLKPGLIVLVAAEEPPSYVAVAQQALESTGFTIKSGSGYRAYSEERKRADPACRGSRWGRIRTTWSSSARSECVDPRLRLGSRGKRACGVGWHRRAPCRGRRSRRGKTWQARIFGLNGPTG